MQQALILQEGSALCERARKFSVSIGKKLLVGCDSIEVSIGRIHLRSKAASRNLTVRMQQGAFADLYIYEYIFVMGSFQLFVWGLVGWGLFLLEFWPLLSNSQTSLSVIPLEFCSK